MPKRFTINVLVGNIIEQVSVKLLEGSEWVAGENHNFPYDILWNDLRINSKAGRRHRKKCGEYYTFKLHDNHKNCDFFLLVGYSCGYVINTYETINGDKNLKEWGYLPEKAWLVPSKELEGKAYITLSPNQTKRSRFYKYKLEGVVSGIDEFYFQVACASE